MTESGTNHNPHTFRVTSTRIVHVDTPNGKQVTVQATIQDTPEVDTLLNAPSFLRRMIITSMEPLKNNPDRTEIMFRHLTRDEAEEQNSLVAPFMQVFGKGEHSQDMEKTLEKVKEIFERNAGAEVDGEAIELGNTATVDVEDELGEAEKEFSELQSQDEILAQVNEFMERDEELALLAEKNSHSGQMFRVLVPTSIAHLAQILCAKTEAPALALTSKDLPADQAGVPNWDDFIALLELAPTNAPEYFEAINPLMEHVLGKRNIQVIKSDAFRQIATILATAIDYATGNPHAHDSALALTEGIDAFIDADEEAGGKLRIDYDAAVSLYAAEVINMLYQATSPEHVIPRIKQGINGDIAGETEEDPEVEDAAKRLWAMAGLEDVFTKVLTEEYASTSEFRLSKSPTKEELAGYYSTPITPATLPAPMAEHYSKDADLFDLDWNRGLEVAPMDHKQGVALTQVAVLGVRYARLLEMYESGLLDFPPVDLFLRIASWQTQNLVWVFSEAICLTVGEEEAKTDSLIYALLSQLYPRVEGDEQLPPQQILQTPLNMMLHMIGHTIMAEEWDADLLKSKLSAYPTMVTFVDNLVQNFAQLEGADPHEAGSVCPSMVASLEVLGRSGEPPARVAGEFIELVKVLAWLQVLKNTNFEEGTEEWFEAEENYLYELFGPEDEEDNSGE